MGSGQTGPPYRGVSRGPFRKFKTAAKRAEHAAKQDLVNQKKWKGQDPVEYKAELYVRSGNPIHEYIVELTPRP